MSLCIGVYEEVNAKYKFILLVFVKILDAIKPWQDINNEPAINSHCVLLTMITNWGQIELQKRNKNEVSL